MYGACVVNYTNSFYEFSDGNESTKIGCSDVWQNTYINSYDIVTNEVLKNKTSNKIFNIPILLFLYSHRKAYCLDCRTVAVLS